MVTNTVSGLPIAGATVVVVDSANVTNTLTTDATGHYAVTNIAAGVATVTASQTGYTTATASPTIVAGANTQDLGLTANTLTGVVTDAITSLPIAGATVQVTDSSNGVHTVTTDAAGHYGVTNLPTGPATVTASQTGYASASASPTIVPGANTQDLSLTANTLTGQVTDAGTHQPIAGATVQVVDSAGTTNTLTTDASGYYGVTNIATGVATVTVSKTGYNPATATPTIVAGPNTQDVQLTASTPTLALLSYVKAFVADRGCWCAGKPPPRSARSASTSTGRVPRGTSGSRSTPNPFSRRIRPPGRLTKWPTQAPNPSRPSPIGSSSWKSKAPSRFMDRSHSGLKRRRQ